MKKTTIDIQAFINEHPFTKYQWMILALCFITVAMDGFDTAIIGFIASDLVQEWGVEKSALGPVMSAALVGLAVGALTAGPLADRVGRKIVLIMSIVVFGGFSLLLGFGMVWQIWWMAGFGLLGMLATYLVRAFNGNTEYCIPAAEVEKIEAQRYAQLAAHGRPQPQPVTVGALNG